ncbi:hypothetical protein F5Y14DRAFT_400890 [Nemania sp. NC0429]|nr:hypothetical protein F5Y14DRAFT_400890 [Nemania sp. NC0429]
MSDRENKGVKPPTPEELNQLRAELRSLQLKGVPNALDEDAIDRILLLPPSLFYEAVRNLALAFGPLSSFPAVDNPFAAITPIDNKLKSKEPGPIVDDGASFLEDAFTALADYNKLLEEKVSKFNVQSARSLATLRESAASDHSMTPLHDAITEASQRKLLHAQQIATLKDSLDLHDKDQGLKLEGYTTQFWNHVLLLDCFDTLFHGGDTSAPPRVTSSKDFLDEYDNVIQHVERWRRLVDVDPHEGEATIKHARHHVNQLVYLITHHCQVQLATVFHESLVDNAGKSNHQDAVHDEAADIIKEIEWLWEEVIPVAHMSVSAQFLRPVLAHFKNWEDSKKYRMAVVSNYTSGALRFMNDRLSAVIERMRLLVYHHQAAQNVARVARVRQSKEASGSVGMVSGQVFHSLAQNTQPKREYATASENLQAFMKLYGAIPIHVDDPFSKPTPSILEEYVQNRAHKGDTLLQDLHKHFEAAAKSSLTDQELGGELLLDSLLADSAASPLHVGSVYKDTQLEGSIAMLEAQAKQVQGMFKELKLEGPATAPDYVAHAYKHTANQPVAKVGKECVRGPKFEEFVRKWAH